MGTVHLWVQEELRREEAKGALDSQIIPEAE